MEQRFYFFCKFTMASKQALVLVVLSELIDPDDEKQTYEKIRTCIKRRSVTGYFTNMIRELKVGDKMGFKEIFRISVEVFKMVLKNIDDMIFPHAINGGYRPILSNERLTLTLRYLAIFQSFSSLYFHFQISLSAVSYIIKGCCDVIVEESLPPFVKMQALPGERTKKAEK